ncbi:MAG TPA: type II toxin-antitoxin system VapC family toxin [Terriglobales bacterium]|jgi:ribonuclease VapC
MIIDSSAIIAILRNEPEAPDIADAIDKADICRVSAVSYLETAMVIDASNSVTASRRFDDFFRQGAFVIESVTPEHAQIAREAYRDFGKGKHRASLNFGDCFVYALAKDTGEPLLYKGNDFNWTDLELVEF